MSTVPLPAHSAASSASSVRAQELAAFLRRRRESLDPVRLGLPRGGRRRTPGLRREEVAQLAGVGVTWYTWLEQGRDIRVSPQALAAIAQALQCTDAETRHLFLLSGLSAPTPPSTPACQALSPVTAAIIDQLHPFPAMVLNARYDIMGFNQAYCRLMGVDLADIPADERNCIYLSLSHPRWLERLMDREESLARMVASFRAGMSQHHGDPAWERQLQRYFDVSPAFADVWQRYEVRSVENLNKRFCVPGVGELTFQQRNWWSAPQNGDRLLVFVPADPVSAQRLATLVEMP